MVWFPAQKQALEQQAAHVEPPRNVHIGKRDNLSSTFVRTDFDTRRRDVGFDDQGSRGVSIYFYYFPGLLVNPGLNSIRYNNTSILPLQCRPARSEDEYQGVAVWHGFDGINAIK